MKAPPPTLDIQTAPIGDDTTRLSVLGELDMATASQLGAALDAIASDERVVLDLVGVTFLDCAGLRVLETDHAARQRQGGRLLVRASMHGIPYRVIEMGGLLGCLDVENAA